VAQSGLTLGQNMLNQDLLQSEVLAFRRQGLSNRQITAKLAEIISYRFRERPTQALIMDLLRDRDAGKCPSASTIQSGLKDFLEKQAEQRKGPLGPESWPDELRVEATEVLSNLDRWATAKAEQAVDEIRRKADQAVSDALAKSNQAERDRDLAISQTQQAEENRAKAELAREESEKHLVDVRARLEELQIHAERLSETVNLLQVQMEETRVRHEGETAAKEADFQQKMDRLLDEYHRDKDAKTLEINKLEQLLTAGEETLKRLRVDVQREVDRSELMRSEMADVRAENKLANADNLELRLALAEKNGQIDRLEKDVARLSRLRGHITSPVKAPRKSRLR